MESSAFLERVENNVDVPACPEPVATVASGLLDVGRRVLQPPQEDQRPRLHAITGQRCAAAVKESALELRPRCPAHELAHHAPELSTLPLSSGREQQRHEVD